MSQCLHEHGQKISSRCNQESHVLDPELYQFEIWPGTGLDYKLPQRRQGCQDQCGHAGGKHLLCQSKADHHTLKSLT